MIFQIFCRTKPDAKRSDATATS